MAGCGVARAEGRAAAETVDWAAMTAVAGSLAATEEGRVARL